MTSSTGTFPVLDGRWYWPFPLKFQVIEKFSLDIANVHWTLSITTARPQLLSTGIAHRFCSPLLCIITKSCLVSSRWELPDATRAVTPWKPKLTRFQSSTCYCDFEWIFWKLYNELHNENLIMRSSLKRWCLWMAANRSLQFIGLMRSANRNPKPIRFLEKFLEKFLLKFSKICGSNCWNGRTTAKSTTNCSVNFQLNFKGTF